MEFENKQVESENKTEVKLAPPWIQYVNALSAMFQKDPEIAIAYNNDDVVVRLMVNNPVKAEALQQLLPLEKEFGNVVLKIIVVPANIKMTKAQLYQEAFRNNPAFVDAVPIEGAFSNPLLYIVFAKEVVQYYNDDLSDLHGNRSTLYQTLADEIFNKGEGVLFCTDV